MTPSPRRREAPPAAEPQPGRSGGSAAPALLVLAELTLMALTISAAFGLSRLFVDGSFLVPVVGFAFGGHVIALLCRRSGMSGLGTVGVGAVALVFAVSWFLLPDTLTYGLPMGGTLAAAIDQLGSALTTFREVVAPAPVEPGFVLAAAIGVWIVAFTADTAAFRASAPVEAVVPATTLFLFAAALGAAQARTPITVAFLLAVLAYWLVQRALRQARTPTWMTTDSNDGSASVLKAGALLAVVAVAAAVAVGPRVPGAGDGAVIPWRAAERQGGGARVTVSPLVDIRSRIVEQAGVEVFTVDSNVRSYWRLTSLETFDGETWTSKGKYRDAEGRLESSVDAELADSREAVQRFEIEQLDSIWLPAAYEPIAVQGTDASYDDESGSLLTNEGETTTEGLTYTVRSQIKDVTAEQLAGVENRSDQVPDVYTEVPDGLNVAVQERAYDIAGDPSLSPYEKALALQDHFRNGDYVYDLSVQPGHDGDALDTFLSTTKTGYCEQFAGAYAALARIVGLPSRVAVGFTPGEQTDDGRYVVKGLNGHAWPEVFLDGFGWVPFEPTPDRGIPGGEDYTGVADQQASAEDSTTATSFVTTTTVAAAAPLDGSTTLPTVFAETPESAAGGDDRALHVRLARPVLTAAALALALPLLWLVLLVVAARLRQLRRRSAARTPGDRVRVAWAEAGEALARAGVRRHDWETPHELAARGATATAADATALTGLAEAATTVDFAEGAVTAGTAEDAERRAEEVKRAIRQDADWRRRLAWAMDPRPLLPRLAARRDVREAEGSGTMTTAGATPLS